MALVFYDEKTAERLFEHTFIKWLAYGYKGCYSPRDTERELVDATSWAWNSKTARDLMAAVTSSEKQIYVVGMRGGFQCFNSTEGPDQDLPVVFIDLDGRLTVNVRTPHNLHWTPNTCRGTVLPLPNRIALLHEFGHAWQWIERPLMFDNQKGKATPKKIAVTDTRADGVAKWNDDGTVKQKMVTVKGGKFDFDARLEKGKFASAIKARAEQTWSKLPDAERGFLRTGDDTGVSGAVQAPKGTPDEYEPPKWGVTIEEDNMSRHEWPICIELDLPLRKNYRDVNAETTGAPSPTSIIALKAAKFEQEEAARKAAKDQEMAALIQRGQQKYPCPKTKNGKPCTKICKTENELNMHFKFEHRGTD